MSSYIEESIPFNVTQSFTISGWYKRGAQPRRLTIASVESRSSNNSIFWVGLPLDVKRPGVTAFVSVNPQSEDQSRVLSGTSPSPLETWQHFAFVMRINATDAAGGPLENVFIMYVNGHQEADMVLGAGLLDLPNVSSMISLSMAYKLIYLFSPVCVLEGGCHKA